MADRIRSSAAGGAARPGRAGAGWPSLALAGLALALTPALGGCSDRVYDAGLVGAITGDGPPPDQPTPIRGITGAQDTYPSLSTVPARPTDVPLLAERERDLATLEQQRAGAQATAKALEERYQPLTIPAPAKVTPGRRN